MGKTLVPYLLLCIPHSPLFLLGCFFFALSPAPPTPDLTSNRHSRLFLISRPDFHTVNPSRVLNPPRNLTEIQEAHVGSNHQSFSSPCFAPPKRGNHLVTFFILFSQPLNLCSFLTGHSMYFPPRQACYSFALCVRELFLPGTAGNYMFG